MGWLVLLGIALLAAVLLWRLGVAQNLWAFIGAGLMLGAAGDAWQAHPDQPGHPVEPNSKPIAIDPEMVKLRGQMFGISGFDNAYFVLSDAMLRQGDAGAAAGGMLAAINQAPRDVAMWTGLGTTLAVQGGDQVTPASKLAFEQAMRLAPQHPAPYFFYGMALVKAGRFADARPYWVRAWRLSPDKADYKREIGVRLFLLDRYLQLMAQGQQRP